MMWGKSGPMATKVAEEPNLLLIILVVLTAIVVARSVLTIPPNTTPGSLQCYLKRSPTLGASLYSYDMG